MEGEGVFQVFHERRQVVGRGDDQGGQGDRPQPGGQLFGGSLPDSDHLVMELQPTSAVGRRLPEHPLERRAVGLGKQEDGDGVNGQVVADVQRRARPVERPGDIEARAMPIQKRPRIQPVTFVHDQFRPATRHRQPARSTARIVSPIVW